MLTLTVNGETRETQARTLAELVAELGFDPGGVATAVDGAFVPRDARTHWQLAAGAVVEILAPVQGG
ncbi:MAG: hypothetical protein KatS3mg124_0807 [Porticoccaceae bacterium]|nr:MAG: hypothetical protein KatS3mg124_0807 [Porticoccaceae bacterium]